VLSIHSFFFGLIIRRIKDFRIEALKSGDDKLAGWHGQVFLAMGKQIDLTETTVLKST